MGSGELSKQSGAAGPSACPLCLVSCQLQRCLLLSVCLSVCAHAGPVHCHVRGDWGLEGPAQLPEDRRCWSELSPAHTSGFASQPQPLPRLMVRSTGVQLPALEQPFPSVSLNAGTMAAGVFVHSFSLLPSCFQAQVLTHTGCTRSAG